jgi:periplasmic divalent cation tolerance protein
MEDSPLLVLCTAPNSEVGARLARGLVEARLAACVNLVPEVRSFYTWKGALEDEREVQLLIKTRRSRYEALENWIVQNHPYEVPELLALDIAAGHGRYLDWLREQTEP